MYKDIARLVKERLQFNLLVPMYATVALRLPRVARPSEAPRWRHLPLWNECMHKHQIHKRCLQHLHSKQILWRLSSSSFNFISLSILSLSWLSSLSINNCCSSMSIVAIVETGSGSCVSTSYVVSNFNSIEYCSLSPEPRLTRVDVDNQLTAMLSRVPRQCSPSVFRVRAAISMQNVKAKLYKTKRPNNNTSL